MGEANDGAVDPERDLTERALDELAHLATVVLVAAESVGRRIDDD